MGRRRVTIVEDGNVIRIKGWKVADLARAAGLKPTYSGVNGWTLDTKRLPDFTAYLGYRNVDYAVDRGGAKSPVLVDATPPTVPAPRASHEDTGLW